MEKDFFQITIDTAYEQFITLKKKIAESGYDRQYAEKIMNANNPDEEFMARKLLQLTSTFDEIGNMVQYLHKPVRIEGDLCLTKEGWKLNNEKVADGATVEFMHEGKWYIGRLICDGKSGQYSIVSEDKKITCTRPNNVRVRMR